MDHGPKTIQQFSMFKLITLLLACIIGFGCSPAGSGSGGAAAGEKALRIVHNGQAGTLAVFRGQEQEPVLTQNAKADARPYIHPILAPDGKGVFTQYRPGHHLHQTGLYWGLKKLNGRDYFIKWQGDYWRRVSARVVEQQGPQVKWQTQYDLLDSTGTAVLRETQNWTMQQHQGQFLLDLEWKGEAKTDVTLGKFYVGGLFLRMPWHKGLPAEVVNAAGQRNQQAEGQRAEWLDVGMPIQGREDWGHIALLDHPQNKAFPISWRVDGELGVGPSRQIMGDWKIAKGQTEVIRYRLVVYTGAFDQSRMARTWKAFSAEDF
jgi:hypothetical protein